jgi:hypothetical protein
MHHIEPHYRWRDDYIASEDSNSPFYGRKYSEFHYSHQLYNFYLHPQWDEFGSSTLYGKILFVDYVEGFTLIELIGEWNDTLHNDIMFLKRNVVDRLMGKGITKFVFFCENVLNFHAAEDDYYAEWVEELNEEDGWVALLNTRKHVYEEMYDARLDHYLLFGDDYNDINWRTQKPGLVFHLIEALVKGQFRRIEG